jgi:AcrR family transcriptional regulator
MSEKQEVRRGPGRPPNPGRKIQRRKTILTQAVTHFARDGFAKTDVGVIAEAAECSKGTVYNYFSSKQELFRESVDHVMEGLVETIDASATDDRIESFGLAIENFLRYFDENPSYIEMLIQERAVFKDRCTPSYHEYCARHQERHSEEFIDLMDRGIFRRQPVDRLFDIISDLLYGTIFTNYFAKRTICLEKQAKQITDLLLNGLLAPDAK